jgi:Family of unknown function (DUF6464)
MKPLNLKEILELPVGSKLAVEVKSTTDIHRDGFFYCKLLSVANERVKLTLEIVPGTGVESFHHIDLALMQETVIHHAYINGITQQISIDESGIDRIYSIRKVNSKSTPGTLKWDLLTALHLSLHRSQWLEDDSLMPDLNYLLRFRSQRYERALGLDEISRPETNLKYNNTNCVYNTNSPHLKCTVHPSGSCDGCKDFEPISAAHPQKFTIRLIHPILNGKLSAENIQELESINPIEFFPTIELRGVGESLMINFNINIIGQLEVWTYLDKAIWDTNLEGNEISFCLSFHEDLPRPWVRVSHSSRADTTVGIPVSAKKRFVAREISERLSRML